MGSRLDSFELARLFDELAGQVDEGGLHVYFLRLSREFHALFCLMTIFLGSRHPRPPVCSAPICYKSGIRSFRSRTDSKTLVGGSRSANPSTRA